MGSLSLTGLLVSFEDWEIDNPGEGELFLAGESELSGELGPERAKR